MRAGKGRGAEGPAASGCVAAMCCFALLLLPLLLSVGSVVTVPRVAIGRAPVVPVVRIRSVSG